MSSQNNIHPTAIVSDSARIGANVTIGPFTVVAQDVSIGDGCRIGSHCVIHSHTHMGERNTLHAHVMLGDSPQHTAFEPGTISRLEIGNDNIFREMVTIHRGLTADSVTQVGSGIFFMTNTHIGHDCVIGDHVIMTTNVGIAGHVEVGEYAVLGGAAAVHQFVRIGAYAMVAACSMVRKDLLPYCLAGGTESAHHFRLNTIGLRRHGITGERYRALEEAYRALRDGGRLTRADTEETRFMQHWLTLPSKRGLAGFTRVKD